MLDKDSREFKVRIVERLTFLEQRLNGPQQNPSSNNKEDHQLSEEMQNLCLEDNIKERFEEMENLDSEVLETMNKEFIMRVMNKLIKRMKDEIPEEERIELLN